MGGVSSETTMSLEDTVGQGSTLTKTEMVTSFSGTDIKIDAGESARVNLKAYRGTLKARVYYEQYLTGMILAKYKNKYKDFRKWGLGASNVVKANGVEYPIKTHQDIEVGFYSDSKVEVIDTTEKKYRVLNVIDLGECEPVVEDDLVLNLAININSDSDSEQENKQEHKQDLVLN